MHGAVGHCHGQECRAKTRLDSGQRRLAARRGLRFCRLVTNADVTVIAANAVPNLDSECLQQAGMHSLRPSCMHTLRSYVSAGLSSRPHARQLQAHFTVDLHGDTPSRVWRSQHNEAFVLCADRAIPSGATQRGLLAACQLPWRKGHWPAQQKHQI
jgi:hypothetical protein